MKKALFFISIFSIYTVSQSAANDGAYETLRNIKCPQELLFPFFPRHYCAEVKLSGPVAEEMDGTIKSLGLKTPSFRESFNGKSFHLSIIDNEYPEQTRELLSGILNPLEFIDFTVKSLLKYQNGEAFEEIKRNTIITMSRYFPSQGHSALRITLCPKGERFGYNYEDNGAFVQESWFTRMSIVIDSSLNIVHELSAVKITREFSGDSQARPSTDTSTVAYQFFYNFRESHPFPISLSMLLNGKTVFKINAKYRNEGENLVFDKKEICSVVDDSSSCLTVTYGSYRMDQCREEKVVSKQKYSKRMEKASLLAVKASDELRKGNISSSMRVLQQLVGKYGDTPQAVEARRLLARLPSNMQ